MRRAPVALSILKRLAPGIVKEGVLFAVAPQRIQLAPWLDPLPNGEGCTDDFVRSIWSFGLRAPLLGRGSDGEDYQLIAEPEFLEVAVTAEIPTVRLHVVNVDDAFGRAIALAARTRRDDTRSVSALRTALEEAGVQTTPDLLAEITLATEYP